MSTMNTTHIAGLITVSESQGDTVRGIDARNALMDLGDKLTRKVSGFASFEDLLGAWKNHHYRPTLNDLSPETKGLADIYDYVQKVRGVEVQAYRSHVTMPAKPARHVARVGDKVSFDRGMYGKWEGRISKLYTGRASRDRMSNSGEPMALVSFTMRNGRRSQARIRIRYLTDLTTSTQYDVKGS
jgi:hypothetical protein